MSDKKTEPSPGTDQDSSLESEPTHDRKQAPRLGASGNGTTHALSDGEGVLDHAANETRAGQWGTILRLWNWKPKPARYDVKNPPKFTIWLNLLFAFVRSPKLTTTNSPNFINHFKPQASCFTVSNLYYNQAILNRIAETFNVSFEKASSVATLMQAGYAGGLLLICPLGDIFPRRPFIISLVGFTATLVTILTPN